MPIQSNGRYEPVASVVILTKNPGDIFHRVLQAVLNQNTPWLYEVIVLDSGSTDGTVEFIKQQESVKLLQISPREFQHGRSRNQAISHVRGEFVAMLTHDALPLNENWLSNLVKGFNDDPSVAGVFGRHIAYETASPCTKRDLQLHFDHFLTWPKAVYIEDQARYASDQGYRQVLHFFSDNNACLRKSVWEKIPYPEVDFAEDQLWAKKIIEAGYKKAYANNAVVYHSHDYNIRDTFRRSFDEAKALQKLFGYELASSLPRACYQVLACSWRDVNHLVNFYKSMGRPQPAGLLLSTPLLQAARQLGYYLGQRSSKMGNKLNHLFSLDDAIKRKGL